MSEGGTKKRAVALVSGGLDSATALAIAVSEGYEAHTLSVDYGQRHRIELERAARISASLGAASHRVMGVDLRAFGGSALTGEIDVPKQGGDSPSGGIPVTYVPARNTVFLSLALAYAETLETGDIFMGVNAVDYSGYPDCRPEYVAAFEAMANLAVKQAVEGRIKIAIHAPLISMTKKQIIQTGAGLGVDFSMTISCYDPAPDGRPCGGCESCRLRAKGFAEAGIEDTSIK